MGKSFDFKSVLNTDLFDKFSFKKIYGMSQPMQEAAGKQENYPAFPHLLGDVWASLYKLKPQVMEGDLHPDVAANRPIMQKILEEDSFHQLRETTKLDEMASALGSLHMQDRLASILHDASMQQAKEQAKKAQEMQDQLRQMEEFLNQSGNESLSEEEQNRLQEELQQLREQASNAASKAEQEVQKALNRDSGRRLQQFVQQTAEQTKQDVSQIQQLMAGLGYGSGQGELKKLPLRDRLMLAEKLRNSKKLKDVADLAGRMKSIAKKKQKSKASDSTGRAGMEYGSDIDRLTAQELLLYTKKSTRTDFLQRFAEGKVMQYAPQAKEKLGKGPIVGVIDTSGSMEKLDSQAKAVLLALLAIAKKQHRAFGVVNFSSTVKTWSFPKGNPSAQELMEVIETFWNGGTDFEMALDQAVQIMESSTFEKGDVVFITDGNAHISEKFLNTVLESKKRKQYQILSIQLGYERTETLEKFSDHVMKASSLFDDGVTDRIFSI